MADSKTGEIGWYSPDPRAILIPDQFHTSRSLRRRLDKAEFYLTEDLAFGRVISACAEPRSYEADTWINQDIITTYTVAHEAGLAHSIEAWSDQSREHLLGGIYGVALGGAFFGESMFSRATDASKVCLAHLADRLRRRGFVLLDTQFLTPHLKQFGVVEIPRSQYLERLSKAIRLDVFWS